MKQKFTFSFIFRVLVTVFFGIPWLIATLIFANYLLKLAGLILLLGVTCNYMAVLSNGFKMPVKYKKGMKGLSQDHFTYKSKKKVKFWYFTDIFHFKIFKFHLAISIGDILISVGVILLIVGTIIK